MRFFLFLTRIDLTFKPNSHQTLIESLILFKSPLFLYFLQSKTEFLLHSEYHHSKIQNNNLKLDNGNLDLPVSHNQ